MRFVKYILNIHKQELALRAKDTNDMRRETYTCHGCCGTNSVLAVKINIVLEININSTSSAARIKGTNDLKTLKISWSATFQFKDIRKKKNKERKHLRAITKGKTEMKWRVNEERCKLYENLNLGHDHI